MAEEQKSGNLVRKRKPNTDSYETYIKSVKEILFIDANIQLKDTSVAVIDDMISVIFSNLKKRALELTHLKGVKTVTFSAIKHAGLLELPADIVQDAVRLASIAMLRRDAFDKPEDNPMDVIKAAIKVPGDPLIQKYGKNIYFLNSKLYNERVANAKNDKIIRSEVKGGIIFPVGRIQRHLKLNQAYNLSNAAAFLVAALLEIITITILKRARSKMPKGKVKISPRHIMLAIQQDTNDIMLPMFHNIIIEGSGEPKFQYEYLAPAPKKKMKTKVVSK